MKAKYILCLVASAIGLTACDNYFDTKYLDNAKPQISEVKTYFYTLTDADYNTIAKNKSNEQKALDIDTVQGGRTQRDALANVGKNKYFDTIAQPKLYLPAFLYSMYPHLDNGSVFKVTYRIYDGLPEYMDLYNSAEQYTLATIDYEAIWGESGKKYLTPDNENRIPDILPQKLGRSLLYVKYTFAEAEGEPTSAKELFYIDNGDGWKPYGTTKPQLYILPTEAHGQVDKWIANTFLYPQKKDNFILMQYNSKTQLFDATEYTYDGEQWAATTGVSEEIGTYGLEDIWAEMPVYYKQAVAGDENQGQIKTQDFDLEDGITYIWAFDSRYGMKGTAYKSGPHYGEGWFVTPAFMLKNAVMPALSFEHAVNYGPADETRYEQMTVWVSTDYNPADENADVRNATWTQLPWNDYDGKKFDDTNEIGFPDANSWTFYNSGNMDLSEWRNQTIVIGFRYKSVPGQTCATWEVKNIIVKEP